MGFGMGFSKGFFSFGRHKFRWQYCLQAYLAQTAAIARNFALHYWPMMDLFFPNNVGVQMAKS